MVATPRVSAVVVAYRSGEALTRCLESVLAAPAVREVIVVDNGGGGPEIEAARSLAGVHVLDPAENLGYGAGCNAGAAEARGDVLLFLNADTEVDTGAPEALATALTDPDIGVAVPRILLLDDPERLNSAGNAVHLTGLAWPAHWGEPATSAGERRDVGYASGSALAIRAETFRELGGFAEELFLYQEDLELSWRARLAGLRVVVEPSATVAHAYHYDRLDAEKHYWLERNRLVFVLTAYSGRLLALLAPILLGRRDRPRRPCPTRWLVEREARRLALAPSEPLDCGAAAPPDSGPAPDPRPRGRPLPHGAARSADARGAGSSRATRAARSRVLDAGETAPLATSPE